MAGHPTTKNAKNPYFLAFYGGIWHHWWKFFQQDFTIFAHFMCSLAEYPDSLRGFFLGLAGGGRCSQQRDVLQLSDQIGVFELLRLVGEGLHQLTFFLGGTHWFKLEFDHFVFCPYDL